MLTRFPRQCYRLWYRTMSHIWDNNGWPPRPVALEGGETDPLGPQFQPSRDSEAAGRQGYANLHDDRSYSLVSSVVAWAMHRALHDGLIAAMQRELAVIGAPPGPGDAPSVAGVLAHVLHEAAGVRCDERVRQAYLGERVEASFLKEAT